MPRKRASLKSAVQKTQPAKPQAAKKEEAPEPAPLPPVSAIEPEGEKYVRAQREARKAVDRAFGRA